MTGFALDENNDILIKDNQIQMINGSELTKQTIQTVIGTNKGEWCLNEDEGKPLIIFLENIRLIMKLLKLKLNRGCCR